MKTSGEKISHLLYQVTKDSDTIANHLQHIGSVENVQNYLFRHIISKCAEFNVSS